MSFWRASRTPSSVGSTGMRPASCQLLTRTSAWPPSKPWLSARRWRFCAPVFETVVEGETGLFFDRPTPTDVVNALRVLLSQSFDEEQIAAHARRFDEESFASQSIRPRGTGLESRAVASTGRTGSPSPLARPATSGAPTPTPAVGASRTARLPTAQRQGRRLAPP